MSQTPTDADDSTDSQPTATETWYTVMHNGLTVHTQDASAADHASRSGARVTATTRRGA